MDTKSKNNKSVPGAALLISLALLTLSFLAAADVIGHRKYLTDNYYFQSHTFTDNLKVYSGLVSSFHLVYDGFEQKTDDQKIGEDEIQRLRLQKGLATKEVATSLQDEYSQKIQEALRSGDQAKVTVLGKELAQKLDEVRAKYDKWFEDSKKEILNYKTRDFENLKNSYAIRDGAFYYYIQDLTSGKVYTNTSNGPDDPAIREKELYSVSFPQTSFEDPNLQSMNITFQQNNWKGVFIVPLEAKGISQIHADYTYFNTIRDRLVKEIVISITTLLGACLLYYFYRRRCLHEQDLLEKPSALLRKIPIDVRAALFLIICFLTILLSIQSSFFYFPIGLNHILLFTVMFCLLFVLLLNIREEIRLFYNKSELHQQWQSSMIVTISSLVKESFVYKSILFKVLLVLLLTSLLGLFFILALMGLDDSAEELVIFAIGYFFLYLAFVVPYILRRVSLFSKIFKGAEEIAAGNLTYSIDENGQGNLSHLARNINNMKQGFKQSLESHLKSERLKSELITNVSHDLKTPLTSIVNYIDLLKREDVTSEQTKQYIDVLDRKALRLKTLIDDLFEASKVASGSVELSLERVNIANLLNQALAECSDQIEKSSLTFRVNVEKPQMFAYVDGNKTWRVFENLISNSLKYSQPDTRVYLSLEEQETFIVLTIKNVSAYEIDFDVNELFERFKRADQSRHTEGSGLGLAIAKSIMDLQGGQLVIEVDGDYFKVIVRFVKG
ncbi:histidine kinase dimerization/phospho-acceptor domain-containing protein [Brevibacillus sp. SYSU BS000544]|uniref:sensor histidine kinase n=1 Tax=Brevibacillus sp. SYSU BS000544 TaxID=3416443 RepID=UPI003CE4CD24